ncbi:extracellular factor (EF) 3-hydroxypalmitic acid methyl ester biosynthesis protein [Bradyrhizobium sp. Ghvi]|uniref:class I SAM-dependent methyltransferase n=1 Tax=Bradyrhizobium sp. Ghvi TaxID=1855319 RepID=UPI0008F201AF|nr:class I SAM-dependent methyltransferase [Bradyrhizobium sp. Ghvi]SFQ37038.1 extracellular factor (EF) 3-hydroxypalmitic acid methyl ester biosynthesis protein [Bradyrhizobium sp. Ghvi]
MSETLERLDLSDLQRQVAAFSRFFAAMPASPAGAMHGTVAEMHALCGALAGVPPALWRSHDVQDVLRPAAELQALSPFVRRLREWPRGYPGDFETIELLVRGAAVPTTPDAGAWIDWYALNTAIGQQHRNKIWWQYLKMCAVTPGRILSVGCGGGADFNIAAHRFTASEIVLLDLDQEALQLAQDRLQRYCEVRTICGDVRRGIRKAQDDGPFDIVVCGGLFDYLDDRTIAFLLKELRERAVKEGGTVLFTNIATDNPFRVWMEAIANWKLIHRSEADIRRIVDTAGFDLSNFQVQKDGTGLAHLVEIGCD